jgi:hypothetical protein
VGLWGWGWLISEVGVVKDGGWLFVGKIICPCVCGFLSVEWKLEYNGVVVEVY